MAENRHHYGRDNRWREDRATWRTGNSALVMFVLLAISLNLLRTAARDWTGQTPMTLRSMVVEYTITSTPDTLLQKPP